MLDAADLLQLINPRAERLLQCPRIGPAPSAAPRADLSGRRSCWRLIHSARRRERLQRLEWQLGNQELEASVLAGEGGWVAVILQPSIAGGPAGTAGALGE